MRDVRWSHAEKVVARTAFESALSRELKAIRKEAEGMLQRTPDAAEIWSVQDFLFEKRREIDRKYDYRYSVLISVFGRLLYEGWLTDGDIAALSSEKLELIHRSAAVHKEVDA